MRSPPCAIAVFLAMAAVGASPPDREWCVARIAESAELLDAGDYERSHDLALQAVDAARALDDRELHIQSLQALGNAAYHTRRYDPALDAFREALALLADEEAPIRARLLKDVGIAHAGVGQLERALHFLELAADHPATRDDVSLQISIHGNLGTVYRRLGAHALALSAFEETLRLAQTAGSPAERLDAEGRLGWLFFALGFPGRALPHFERAALSADRAPAAHRAWLLEGLAGAYEEAGRRDEALGGYRRLLALREESGDRVGAAYARVGVAYLLMDRDPAAARASFARAIELSDDVGFSWAWGARAYVAALDRRSGQLDRAIEGYRSALDGLESYRRGIPYPAGQLSVMRRNRFVYHELIDALLERRARDPGGDDVAEAYHVSERARTRALLEAMAEAQLEPERSVVPELREREAQLRGRLVALRESLLESLSYEATRQDARRSMLDELARTQLQIDELVAAIRRESPGYASLHYPEPVTLAGTQELLDPETALIAYSLTEDRLLAFVVTADDFGVEPLEIDPRQLATRVTNLLDLLTENVGWRPVARRLHDELVRPLEGYLHGGIHDLIVVPDGALHQLPFDVLLSDDTDGYLLQRFSVAYVPSATVLAELSRSPLRERASRVLLFADPWRDAPRARPRSSPADRLHLLYASEGLDPGPLPFAGTEAETVGRYVDAQSAIFTGPAASEKRLKELSLRPFGILHFATHGLVSRRDPARSALLLAPEEDEDGYLQVREISQLSLSPDLVVLSACRTARGPVLAGEGVHGLARAFLQAGARSVLGSLWDIEDRQTARFMAALYRRLSEGHPKARALRLAKLDLLGDARDPLPAPAWSAFVLVGDSRSSIRLEGGGDRPTPSVRPALALAFLVAALAAVGSIAVWRRRRRSRRSRRPRRPRRPRRQPARSRPQRRLLPGERPR